MLMFVFYYLFKAALNGLGYKTCINVADLFKFRGIDICALFFLGKKTTAPQPPNLNQT